jgi:hypothetical protein
MPFARPRRGLLKSAAGRPTGWATTGVRSPSDEAGRRSTKVRAGRVARVADLRADLRDAERRLQAAQLAGDVDGLDALLDDRLIATLMPDPVRVTKAQDLAAHRARRLVLTASAEDELAVVVAGTTGVTWVLMSLAGTVDGAAFEARMLYTRTWHHDEPHGWRVLAAHISPVA